MTVIEAREPARFMIELVEAAAGDGTVLLADPRWGEDERRQIAALLQTSVKVGTGAADRLGWLGVPTGGSSGILRFARHDEKTLAAAVDGFCRHFAVKQVNTVGVLPLHHVSGLMGWMRAALTGGTFIPWSWPEMEGGNFPALPPGDWFLSLVPTQLGRLIKSGRAQEWLRGFSAVFVGGGPAWGELLEQAAMANLPLAPTYGMTETAAMVAAVTAAEFLAGARSSGRPLPHARISIDGEGRIRIEGESVFRGYYPEGKACRELVTDDIGRLDANGHLHVRGRRDAVIISGGEKVQPEEVEAVLRASGAFEEVAVLGLPDTEWGQKVVVAYRAATEPDLKQLARFLEQRLAPAKRPKRLVPLDSWPASPQGKISRAELTRLVEEAIRLADNPNGGRIS
ncbi:MAG: AMP-binding protein [Opitutaceae bacterium]|nr:AMP-binding protein [Opitutaceae bacterium]